MNDEQDPPNETVNKINTSTFQQIAHSLSPDPEQLLQQQVGLPLKVARSIAALGSKRRNETEIDTAGAHKRQRTKIEDEGPRNKMYTDVDEVIQGLLQQYQDSQMSSAHNHGATRMSRSASLIAEGVRVGGFRQAAYSDSHQELVKTVQSMSAADIQILNSAQKGGILAYKAQLKPQNQQTDPLLDPSPSPGLIQLQEIDPVDEPPAIVTNSQDPAALNY